MHLQSEIKSIVSRRREFEYLLRRRAPRKSDFLRYIEAEKNLEKLRSLRNKKVLARKDAKEREERKANGDKGLPKKPISNSSIGDASIVQHIHLLYTRAKRKWKQDLSFHIQHAEFAKEKKSHNMLSKIYAEALQIHPRNTTLWIEAASHEYFGYVVSKKDVGMSGGGSIKSARVLLQRGLRVNSDSKDLWLQSFCLELHYIQKIRGRRELLQLGLKKNKIVEDDESEGSDDNANIDSFCEEAKLPRIIYKNAIKAVPQDVVFRIKFIDQCRLFPQTQVIIDEIMTSIENDFGEVEEAWIARAKFAVDDSSSDSSEKSGFLASSQIDYQKAEQNTTKRKHNEIYCSREVRDDAFQILNQATDSLQTPKMFMEAISFARSFINHLCSNLDENELSPRSKRQILKAGNLLKNIVGKVIASGMLSSELAVECTNILTELGSPAKALDFITEIIRNNGDCQSRAECWLKYAEVKARVTGDLLASCRILRNSLKIIPLHDKGHKAILKKLFSDLLVLSSTEFSTARQKELVSIYDKLLLINHQKDQSEDVVVTLPSLSSAYMKQLTSRGGIESVRKVYGKLVFTSNYLQTPNKSVQEIMDIRSFFDQCIIVEKIGLKFSKEGKDQKRQLMRLYDAAFVFFNQNGYSGIADKYTRMKNKEIAFG